MVKKAYKCFDNPEHIFKANNLDGIRCPFCDGLVGIKPVTNEEYERLPKYRELMKKTSRPTRTLDIGVQVDMDTDKLQLKLRAIAKHAEALANELDAIDNKDNELPTRLEGSE